MFVEVLQRVTPGSFWQKQYTYNRMAQDGLKGTPYAVGDGKTLALQTLWHVLFEVLFGRKEVCLMHLITHHTNYRCQHG